MPNNYKIMSLESYAYILELKYILNLLHVSRLL